MVGPNNSYLFSGHGKTGASARGNTIKGYQEGPNMVEFADGTKISFTLPVLNVSGVLWGERTLHYEGGITFTDEKNRLQCDLVFNPDAQGFLKSLFKKQKSGVDCLRGEIVRLEGADLRKKGDVLSTLEGSWLSHVDFDGERLWELERDLPHLQHRPEHALPSDCRHREDLQALAKGDLDEGAECKLMLEERQRYDAKLRQAYKPPKKDKAHKNAPADKAGAAAAAAEVKPVYKDVPASPGAASTSASADDAVPAAVATSERKKKDKKRS